jgi:transposase InsO family protein
MLDKTNFRFIASSVAEIPVNWAVVAQTKGIAAATIVQKFDRFNRVSATCKPNALYARIHVSKLEWCGNREALIDTGASHSFCSSKFARVLRQRGFPVRKAPRPLTGQAFAGRFRTQDVIRVRFTMGVNPQEFEWDFYVYDFAGFDMLLGQDFLSDNGMVTDGATMTMQWKGKDGFDQALACSVDIVINFVNVFEREAAKERKAKKLVMTKTKKPPDATAVVAMAGATPLKKEGGQVTRDKEIENKAPSHTKYPGQDKEIENKAPSHTKYPGRNRLLSGHKDLHKFTAPERIARIVEATEVFNKYYSTTTAAAATATVTTTAATTTTAAAVNTNAARTHIMNTQSSAVNSPEHKYSISDSYMGRAENKYGRSGSNKSSKDGRRVHFASSVTVARINSYTTNSTTCPTETCRDADCKMSSGGKPKCYSTDYDLVMGMHILNGMRQRPLYYRALMDSNCEEFCYRAQKIGYGDELGNGAMRIGNGNVNGYELGNGNGNGNGYDSGTGAMRNGNGNGNGRNGAVYNDCGAGNGNGNEATRDMEPTNSARLTDKRNITAKNALGTNYQVNVKRERTNLNPCFPALAQYAMANACNVEEGELDDPRVDCDEQLEDMDDWMVTSSGPYDTPVADAVVPYTGANPQHLMVPARTKGQRLGLHFNEPLPKGLWCYELGRSGVGGQDMFPRGSPLMAPRVFVRSDGELRHMHVYVTNPANFAAQVAPMARAGRLTPVDRVMPWSELSQQTWSEYHPDLPTTFEEWDQDRRCTRVNASRMHARMAEQEAAMGLAMSAVAGGGDAETPDQRPPENLSTDERFQLVFAELKKNFSQACTPDEERQIKALVRKHYNIFMLEGDQHRMANIPACRLDLYPGALPTSQQLRRKSDYERGVISDYIDKSLKEGIIEPACSEWASNVVLVKKPNGKHRVCIDFRALNEKSLKFRYPMPDVEAMLRSFEGRPYFSTFDLSSAFHQMPMAREDKHKTAFITHRGQFQYRVMPYGIVNGTSNFQKAMTTVLAGLPHVSCWVDDIVVASTSFEEHIKQLGQTFGRLGRAKLSLSAKKSYMFRKELCYLGYVVTGDGIKPNPEKIAAIREWPLPACISEVRAFCGLVNFYRRFIKNCSVVMSPLTDLTKGVKGGKRGSKADIKLNLAENHPAAVQAFEALKEALCTSPVLRHPRANHPYRLEVDACGEGVGAVLSQEFGDGWHPVSYYSKKFTVPEGKWSSNELEAIGVIKALDHFRPYLYGVDFELVSDSQYVVLTWVRRHGSKGKLARWAIRLAEYDGYMKVVPRAGHKSGNCDGLSRRGRRDDEATDETEYATAMGVPPARRSPKPGAVLVANASGADWDDEIKEQHSKLWAGASPSGRKESVWSYQESFDDILRAQKEDPIWSAEALRHRGLLDDQPPDPSYRWQEDLLWKLPNDGKSNDHPRIVIPHRIKYLMISRFHDGFTVPHMGITKTTALIKQGMWWKGMDDDIRAYIRSCAYCQKHKVTGGKASLPLQAKLVDAPGELVSIDIAGPFTKEKGVARWVLTMVDCYSCFVEVVPIHDCSTVAVLAVFKRVWCDRYGWPAAVITDRGSVFESSRFLAWCARHNIMRKRTTREHPQTNANSERVHRWLRERLACLQDAYEGSYVLHVPRVVSTHNQANIDGLDFSPFELWYGRKPRFVIDQVVRLGCTKEELRKLLRPHSPEEIERMKTQLLEQRNAKWERNARGKKIKQLEFNEGDWVMVPIRKAGKLGSSWDGPYPIVRKKGPHVVVVRRMKYGHLQNDTLNVGKLRKFTRRDPVMEIAAMQFQPPISVTIKRQPNAKWVVQFQRDYPPNQLIGVVKGEYLSAEEFRLRYPDGQSKHVYPVRVDGQDLYVDTSNPLQSNWTHFLQECKMGEEPNVVAQVKNGKVRIQTCKKVQGEEILKIKMERLSVPGPDSLEQNSDLPDIEPGDRELNSVDLEPIQEVTEVTPEEMDLEETEDDTEEEREVLYDTSDPTLDRELKTIQVDDFVITKGDDNHPWILGKVVEVCGDKEGTLGVRRYGTYDTGDLSKRKYLPAWYHPKDKKISYRSNSTKSSEPEEYEVSLKRVLIPRVRMDSVGRGYLRMDPAVCKRLPEAVSNAYNARSWS